MILAISFLLSLLFCCSRAGVVEHGASFAPDYILRASAQNISVACASRYSVVVNGTSPGPQIHLQENQTSWVRVYNDMTDQNFTMVSQFTQARPVG